MMILQYCYFFIPNFQDPILSRLEPLHRREDPGLAVLPPRLAGGRGLGRRGQRHLRGLRGPPAGPEVGAAEDGLVHDGGDGAGVGGEAGVRDEAQGGVRAQGGGGARESGEGFVIRNTNYLSSFLFTL